MPPVLSRTASYNHERDTPPENRRKFLPARTLGWGLLCFYVVEEIDMEATVVPINSGGTSLENATDHMLEGAWEEYEEERIATTLVAYWHSVLKEGELPGALDGWGETTLRALFLDFSKFVERLSLYNGLSPMDFARSLDYVLPDGWPKAKRRIGDEPLVLLFPPFATCCRALYRLEHGWKDAEMGAAIAEGYWAWREDDWRGYDSFFVHYDGPRNR